MLVMNIYCNFHNVFDSFSHNVLSKEQKATFKELSICHLQRLSILFCPKYLSFGKELSQVHKTFLILLDLLHALTFYYTIQAFDDSEEGGFWKHCG